MVAWKDFAVGLVCRCVCQSVAVAGRGFVGGRRIGREEYSRNIYLERLGGRGCVCRSVVLDRGRYRRRFWWRCRRRFWRRNGEGEK